MLFVDLVELLDRSTLKSHESKEDPALTAPTPCAMK